MDKDTTASLDKRRLLMAGACVRPLVHDANNLLGAAMAYTELAQMEPGIQGKTARQLGEVVGAITKCSKLMNLYAQLVRPINFPGPYNVVDSVRHAVELRVYVFRVNGVTVEMNLPEALPTVMGYGAATQYAVLALLLEIERSLPGGSGERSLRVSLEEAGDYARLSIDVEGISQTRRVDNGQHGGIDEIPQELDVESARAAIEMQRGELQYVPGKGAVILLPFVGTAAALTVSPLRE